MIVMLLRLAIYLFNPLTIFKVKIRDYSNQPPATGKIIPVV